MPYGATGPNAMDETTLKRLLRAGPADSGRPGADRPGRGCPDEAVIAAFVEQRVRDEERARIEAHLADCDACLGMVAFLARGPQELGAAAPGAVARARDLVQPASSGWRRLSLRWVAAAAGVACVALAAVLVLRSPSTPQAPPSAPVQDGPAVVPPAPAASLAPQAASPGPPAGATTPPAVPSERARTVRKSAPVAPTPVVVFPAENASVSRQDLSFRWQAVPRSLYYEITVVTEDGNLVYQARVEETTVRLPDATRLDPGVKYFVWIKAFLAGGESAKSATVSFRIAGQ